MIKRLTINTAAGFLFFFMLLGFSSCQQSAVYERNLPVDPSGWFVNDSVRFDVEITDTLTPMSFLLSLRHNGDYPYSNIYFFVNTVYPGQYYSRDTIEILLAGKDGKWYGKGFGELKEVNILLKDRVVFPMTGTYTFSFVQAMREDPLVGIEDLGIRIEPAE